MPACMYSSVYVYVCIITPTICHLEFISIIFCTCTVFIVLSTSKRKGNVFVLQENQMSKNSRYRYRLAV